MLLALGLMMVLSASSVLSYQMYDGNSYVLFLRQLVWVSVGLPLAWAASRTPPRILRMLAYPTLILGIVLLALTFTRYGIEVNGNRNWLDFGGPFRLQPSELAKLGLVLWGADLLARKEKLLTSWRHLLIPYVPISVLVFGLVIGQGDLGTALVLFTVVLATLFVIGMPIRAFVLCILLVTAVVLGLTLVEGYRLSRLMNFMDPFADFYDTGWQVAHAIFALGTGGWWGVGIGASREKWGTLPEVHTDMLYAVIGEELGLAGTLVVLLLFLALAFAGIRIALRAPDLFTRLGAVGITGWLSSQALVNIGTVLGMVPVTGIPLPLMSYGGSAMLPTLIALGVLVSFARDEPGARAALAARSARRRGATRR